MTDKEAQKLKDELENLRFVLTEVRNHPYLPPSLAIWINRNLKKTNENVSQKN